MIWLLLAGALFGDGTLAHRPSPVGPGDSVRIGVISGPLGSFAATILEARRIPFEKVRGQLSTGDLGRYDILFVDNLFRLADLNGPAFQRYVADGGVLVVINPKPDGFSRAFSPYDIFIGEYVREGRIVDRKHPLFAGFRDDKLQNFADSDGPFVGNCSFTEPAREWIALAKAAKGRNALIVEAGYGKGWMILTCTRFDYYNAKPDPTHLGDNLIDYAVAKARSARNARAPAGPKRS